MSELPSRKKGICESVVEVVRRWRRCETFKERAKRSRERLSAWKLDDDRGAPSSRCNAPLRSGSLLDGETTCTLLQCTAKGCRPR